MRQNLVFLVTLIGIALFAFPADGAKPDAGPALVAVAQSQLHVREATGHNDGRDVQKFLAAVGLRGNYPWCGAFVAWCCRQVGVPIPTGAGAARAFFRDPNRIVWKLGRTIRAVLPGDICGFRWTGKPYEDHVGIVEIWGTSPLAATLEGNTSGGKLDRDGQGVYRNWRFKSQIYQVARWANNL